MISATVLQGCAALLLLLLPQAQNPSLQRRGQNEAPIVTEKRGRSTLPQDAAGEYLLGSHDELIEIDLDQHQVSGYLTVQGQGASERDLTLNYIFTKTEADGPRLSFETSAIHGVHYSFHGAIVRGEAKSRGEAGYYVLEGELVRYDDAQKSANRRSLRLQSMPGCLEQACQ